MNNIDIAHAFYYSDGDIYNKPYRSMSYEYNRFYSYYTMIAKIVENKHGQKITLMSDLNMSASTAKHLCYLRQASPYPVLYVNMKYGERDASIEEYAQRALKDMEYYSGQKLTRKENRDGFFNAFNIFNNLKENFKIKSRMPAKFIKLYNTLNDSTAFKAYKQQQAQRLQRQQQQQAQRLQKLLKKNNLSELARIAYTSNDENAARIRAIINPNKDFSFVWRDDQGNYKTSQFITLSKQEGDSALAAYKAGKLKHGMRIGFYTVLEITSEFVKIGCHKIPVKNLMEL